MVLQLINRGTLGDVKDWMFLYPQNSYAEVLTPSVAVFEDGTSKEVIKFKWDHMGEALVQ